MKWTVTPFNNSFRPGKKPFDFYITQVSYNPQRAKAVDFSKGYYFVNQSLVGRKGKPIASARSINGAEEVQARRPGRDDELRLHRQVIKPDSTPKVYDTNDAGGPGAQERPDRRARRRPADGVLRHGRAGPRRQGRRPVRSGRARRSASALVLPKGSKLTACVNKALDRLWLNGTIKNLQRIWLAKATGAPVLK